MDALNIYRVMTWMTLKDQFTYLVLFFVFDFQAFATCKHSVITNKYLIRIFFVLSLFSP